MRIVIDLDGVLCPIKQPGQEYEDLEPLPGAVEGLRKLHQDGNYIIIQTARHMATCDSNVGKVMKKLGMKTLQWLDDHGFEYDEIYFGKPNADIYIDDRGVRFTEWDVLLEMNLEEVAKPR